MRGLVVGGGSIGKRHLQNLKAQGVNELGLVDVDAEKRHALARELAILEFPTLSRGLEWSPGFVVVATPTHLHVQPTLEAVRKGFDVFIEKPLFHLAAGLSELSESVQCQKLVSLVGCNMRFHPGPAKTRELIQEGRLGKILFARVHAGSYLPSWRPNSDYRTNYAAREETGGGCLLDGIHEIDLACWYLGDVVEVFCATGHLSSLEIATEDVAVLLCRHASGAMSEIHLDYVQRTYERGCQIVGELGSVFWDFNAKQVRWYDSANSQWTIFDQPAGWELNQMYLDETRHFLDCIATRDPTVLPIPEAIAVMRIAFAAKVAAREHRVVSIVPA
jgi:predicted dehydrogenase